VSRDTPSVKCPSCHHRSMGLARWFAHSLWQPARRITRYHHRCRKCGAILKQATGEAWREVGLVIFGFAGAMTLFSVTVPLLPVGLGWWIAGFMGWTVAGGMASTLLHYPLAKYSLASANTHALPVSKMVSPVDS